MNANNREKQVREDCERWFANHVIEVLHEDGLYRHYRCAKPGTGNMHFHIVTFPGRLIVCGDIGRTALERCPDMLEWAKDSVHSTGYFEEKAWNCIQTKEFSAEAAASSMRWQHEMLADGLSETDTAKKQKLDAELSKLIDAAEDSREAFVDAYWRSEWSDRGGDFPAIEDYTHEFLRCREAVRWFLKNYRRDQAKEVQQR